MEMTHGFPRYSSFGRSYLARLHEKRKRQFACRARDLDELTRWQTEARRALWELLKVEEVGRQNPEHQVIVRLGETEKLEGYTRTRGVLHTEPQVHLPIWILRPDGDGPFPLALTPHGHTHWGSDQYVGLYHDDAGRRLIEKEERDVAVQAVSRGYFTIAPTTRGFEPVCLRTPVDTGDNDACRHQMVHCLLAGRTALGERLWDIEQLLHWALDQPDVDRRRVLMLGNSGGGVLTALTAAIDPRISVAVLNCCFCTFVGEDGRTHLCDCNTVPGLLRFGEYYDIVGLIAPRPLLIVNGKLDPLYPRKEVDWAIREVRRIYSLADAPDRIEHYYGKEGCRFYAETMWSFVEDAWSIPGKSTAPDSAPEPIEFRTISSSNVVEICELSVSPQQESFIASNAVSIAQGVFRDSALLRGVYVGDSPVGFLMVVDKGRGRYYLWRFMIDHRYQGRGYGHRALVKLLNELATRPGSRSIYLKIVAGEGSAQVFYEKLGFQTTGTVGSDSVMSRAIRGTH